MTQIRILTGDMRSRLSEIDDSSIDVVITDPPYGETSLAWDKWVPNWPAAVRRVLKPTGSMWVFGSFRMFWDHAREFGDWHVIQDVVWEKHNGSSFFNDRFRRVHEYAVQFIPADASWSNIYRAPQFTDDNAARTVRRKGRPKQWSGELGESIYISEDGGPKLMRSVIYARSEHGRAVHPTQKPLATIEPLLLYSCPLGGVVLDPFAGSGGVGVAARRNGRDGILIEADPHFAALAEQRIHGELLLPAS